MVTREEQIASEIRDEFCKRVIPSDLMRYLQCLTGHDIEKVQAEEKNYGSMQAADCLLQRLVRRSDWLHQLKQTLLNPDVGLVDFGKRIELMCQQLTVVVDAPGRCIDVIHCQEETTGASVESNNKITIQNKEKTDTTEKAKEHVSIRIKKKTETTAEIRERVVYQLIDILFKDIKSPSDIPNTLALAEQILVKIDNMARKCLVITFRMNSFESMVGFWQLYQTGGLADVLSHDILTPLRRRHLKEKARTYDIELNDSDVYLQVTIDENNYKFVKDILTFQNVSLLPRSSVESVLLHGSPSESQYDKNKNLVLFRQAMPSKLLKSFDDPFVKDSIPKYFTQLTKLGAVESVPYFYRGLIDKLHAECKDLPDKIFHIAYFLSDCPNSVCEFKNNGNIVEFVCDNDSLSINSDDWEASSEYLEINVNKVKFASNLVMTFFAFHYATETSRNYVSKLLKLELFPLVAGALLTSSDETLSFPQNILVEYLYYKLLYSGSIGDKLFNSMRLNLELNTESVGLLKSAKEDGYEIRLHLYIPPNAKLSKASKDTPGRQMESNDSGVISSKHRILNIYLNPEYAGYLPCPIFAYDMNDLYLPYSSNDSISLVLCIAKAVNLLGSGEVKLKVRADQARTSNKQENDNSDKECNIHYSLYLSPTNKIDEVKDLEDKPQEKSGIQSSNNYISESRGVLRLNLADLNMSNIDILKLETELQNGLLVAKLKLKNTGLKYLNLVKLCNAAFTAGITELVVSDNRLFDSNPARDKSLGLQTLVSLERLEMRNCELGDTGIEVLQNDLLGLKKLRNVDFSKNGFTDEGLRILCNSLRDSTSIRALRVHENGFGTKGGLILSIFVNRLEFLEAINVSLCGLEDSGTVPLVKALQNKTIKKMNFRGNKVTKKGSKEFLHSIKDFKCLYHFDYSKNDIGASQGFPCGSTFQEEINKLLVKALLSCGGSLQYLCLWSCGIGNTTVLRTTRVFSKFQELTEMILQSNELGNKHATVLSKCLPLLKNLKTMHLRSNRIGKKGAKKLTNGIRECPSLQTISLDHNQISDFDVLKTLVETAGRKLTNLKELDVSYNVEKFLLKKDMKFTELLTAAQNCLASCFYEKLDNNKIMIRNDSTTIFI